MLIAITIVCVVLTCVAHHFLLLGSAKAGIGSLAIDNDSFVAEIRKHLEKDNRRRALRLCEIVSKTFVSRMSVLVIRNGSEELDVDKVMEVVETTKTDTLKKFKFPRIYFGLILLVVVGFVFMSYLSEGEGWVIGPAVLACLYHLYLFGKYIFLFLAAKQSIITGPVAVRKVMEAVLEFKTLPTEEDPAFGRVE